MPKDRTVVLLAPVLTLMTVAANSASVVPLRTTVEPGARLGLVLEDVVILFLVVGTSAAVNSVFAELERTTAGLAVNRVLVTLQESVVPLYSAPADNVALNSAFAGRGQTTAVQVANPLVEVEVAEVLLPPPVVVLLPPPPALLQDPPAGPTDR